jgi:hypothetical protein
MNRDAVLFVPGMLFGIGLAISGMSNPAKVIGFLDVTGGSWDPSLAFVMVGAIATFATFNMLVHRRSSAINGAPLPGRKSDTGVSLRLVVGAVIFGTGWGLSGVCPGPALADVASLQIEVFAYLGAMLLGMVIAQRGFGADAPKQKEIASDSVESVPSRSTS